MKTQDELNQIWDAIGDGKYGQDPTVRKPTRVVDDTIEHVMSIPTIDGIGLNIYSRRPGGTWEETKSVGSHP